VRFSAAFCALLLLLGGSICAQAAPVDLSARVRVTTSEPRSSLDRQTGRITSTVQVTLTNTGDRAIEKPLHAAIFFTAESGTLDGLQVPGASGGVGQPPYQTFFHDLSGSIATELAPNASVSFALRFTPAVGARLSYRVVPQGTVNCDPVANAGGPYSAPVGQDLAFTAAASSDPDGDSLTFSWDFGDGSPLSTEPTLSHRYSIPGAYEAVLTVRDSKGANATARAAVNVAPSEAFALARVRTLDGSGLPLGAVEIEETLGGSSVASRSQSSSGFTSLGRGAGDYVWKFSRAGHLPVWRRASLTENAVAIVANPWLQRQATVSTPISPISEAKLTASNVEVRFAAGAFDQPANAVLTTLHTQTLPFPLPRGWSPLAEFHLGLNQEPTNPGSAALILRGPLPSGEEAAFVRFNETLLKWETVALITGTGTTGTSAPVPGGGTYVIAVRDAGEGAPPQPQVGEPLLATSATIDPSGLSASGTVSPAVSVASRDAALVTTTARVTFGSTAQLPSGLFFRTRISESYTLVGGGSARTPDYDTTIAAYRRPANALLAEFPLRPQLLFGAGELQEATVKADLHADGFAGVVVTSAGAVLARDGVRVTVPPGATANVQVAEISTLDPATFRSVTGGILPARAFQLNIGPLLQGAALELAFPALEPNAHYVLGSVIGDSAGAGVTPLERFVSNAQGVLASAEPASGDRLPGIQGSGDYVLLRVDGPQALIKGVARNASGEAVAGLAVRIAEQPWLVFSEAAGAYRIIAPVGAAQLTIIDPADGNEGTTLLNVTDAAQTLLSDATTTPTPPQVRACDPVDGAVNVRSVTPVIVRFSEPVVNFGPTSLELRGAAGSVIPGALSLNAARTEATFLPTNPLAPGVLHEIEVSGALKDATDLPLAGARLFTFTTANSAVRGAGAQLVIFEPGADNVPPVIGSQLVGYSAAPGSTHVVASGSAGTADPQVPVVLVNQTTGETATVLSKPDGSFANFINAVEEDFISAVFVNANGTRVEIAASIQVFDDGRVGLYGPGGILEAESDGGAVEVQVAPNSVRGRNVFKVARLNFAEIQALLNGTVPADGAAVIGGARFEMEGETLSDGAEISIPATAATLGLPPGSDPAAASFALATVREVFGVKVFEVLDKMEFRDGKLTTASPPFLGAVVGGPMMFLKLANGGKAVVTGRAVASTLGGVGVEQPVPGAVVTYHQLGLGGGRPIGGGEIVAVADEKGSYRLLVPLAFFDFQGDSLLLNGLSPLQPSRIGTGKATLIPSPNLAAAIGNVVFASSAAEPLTPDTQAPRISARLAKNDFSPQPGQAFEIIVQAIDNVSLPELTVTSPAVLEELSSQEGTFDRQNRYTVLAPAGAIPVTVTAADAKGNTQTVTFNFYVGAAPPAASFLIDPADTDPPFVLRSEPIQGDAVFDFRRSVKLVFNEPIDARSLRDLANGAVLTPAAGSPFVSISAENSTLELSYPTLKAGVDYTLSLSPNHYRDLAGNGIDQDRINAAADRVRTPFVLSFRTRGKDAVSGLAIENGGGMAASADGTVLYGLERGQGGLLRTYVAAPNGSYTLEAVIELPETPRDLVVIDDFDLVVPDPQNLVARQRKRIPNAQVVLVVGGEVGAFSSEGFQGAGPWVAAFYRVPGAPLERLFVHRVTELGPSLLLKIAYEQGRIGILESGTEATGVNLLNLQLYLWTQHPLAAGVPELNLDEAGSDLNNDGDYGDLGEQIPLPSDEPRIGFINSGLITTATPPSGERVSDFALALGGRFMSAVTVQRAGGTSHLRVLRSQDLPVAPGSAAAEALLPEEGKRVFNLFGTELETGTAARFANLILVSAGERLLVYEISGNGGALQFLTGIDFPNGSGRVQSVQRVSKVFGWEPEGMLAVATSTDVFYLDPRRLLEPVQNGLSPAFSGVVRDFGVGARSFVALANGTVAVALGSRSRLNESVQDVVFTVNSVFAEDVNQAEAVEAAIIDNPPPPSPPVIRESQRQLTKPTEPQGPTNPSVSLLEVVADNFAAPPGEIPLVNALSHDEAIFNRPIVVANAIAAARVANATVYVHADLLPGDVTPGAGFPKWKKDGLSAGAGKSLTVQKSLSLVDKVDYFLDLKPYTEVLLECEGVPLRLNIYPPNVVEKEIELEPVTEALESAFDKLSDAFKATSTGLVTGEFAVEFPEEAQVTFGASFKECPTSNQVFFAPRATATLSPLIGLSGTVKLGPKLPGIGEANVFVELYGRVNLEGTIERVVDETACGEWRGHFSLPAVVGVAVGAKIEVGNSFGEPIVSAELKVDAPVQVTSQVTVKPRWIIESSVAAMFPGITGTLEVEFNFMGGKLTKESSLQLVGPTPLIDPPLVTPLATFPFE
jgi:PKD repeat protein